MRTKTILLILALCQMQIFAQDIGIFSLGDELQRSYLNPGLPVSGKFNLSLVGFQFELQTDGPAINQLTSKNAAGRRYIDVSKFPTSFNEQNNIYLQNQINGIDISFKLGKINILAGHAFNTHGNFQYEKDLVELLARGNASFIGKTLNIGPALNINSYNEIYLGLQTTHGALTLGAKAKLLFGAANVKTEQNQLNFTTNAEFYQLQFDTDFLIRSSGLLKLNNLEDLEFDYPDFTFDNFFYNNRGFAFDLGASLKLNENLTLSASVTDVGSMTWDFSPRKYSSKGSFTFEGIDLIKYLGDTTGIDIADTLINILQFEESFEEYKTNLNAKLFFGASYRFNDFWTFNALYKADNLDIKNRSALSFSAITKLGFVDAGIMYSMRKNNFNSIGLFGKFNVGPFMLFLAAEQIQALWKPFDQKLANIRLGGSFKLE